MAKIKLLGYPAVVAGFKEKEIKIEGKARIREVVIFKKQINEDRIIVLVNHKPATLDTEITDKDNILIMPVIGGG